MREEEKKIWKEMKKLEKRVERLEEGKKPYVADEQLHPYDLSTVAKLRNKHK